MKILWHSNALWANSGYGKQTKLFAPRLLQQLGHEVGVSAFWGLRGARLTVEGMPMYPAGRDGHGNDILISHAKDFFGGDERGGVVLPLTDIWVLRPEILDKLNVAAWVPVDHGVEVNGRRFGGCQPPTVEALRKGKVLPIAMSRHGERMLIEAGFRPLYVPHGFDSSELSPLDRDDCRTALEIPKDAYVVGMVAANQGNRKSYPQALRAFAEFRKTHKDAFLYLHTFLGAEAQGLDLRLLIEQEIGEDEAKKCVLVADQYRYDVGLYSDHYLAMVYSSLDLLMNPSQGEGFGVTILEAQACGTPVLLTNATSMPELCGSGYLVGGTPVYTSFKSWQLLPDIDQLVEALEFDYALAAEDRATMRKRAADFAQPYEVDRVTQDYWVPALAQIERRLLKPAAAAAAAAKKTKKRKRR